MTTTMEAPQTNLPAKAQARPLNMREPVRSTMSLKSLLQSAHQQIADVLPKHLTPDRIMRVALVAVNKTPKLLDCTMESVLQSVIQAASLGLDPGGALGSAYLVPYGNTCQMIPGYRGLIDLARRSGEIQSITADVVYKHDKFTYRKGTDPVLLHEPNLTEEQRDEDIIGAYMVAHLKDGGTHIEFMNRQQIEKIRKGSKAGNNGPWRDHYSEMCRKTVVRRGSKYLPISSEKFAQALEIDNEDADASMTVSLAANQSRTQAVLAKVTGRPVSEGQNFEPTPEAVAEAEAQTEGEVVADPQEPDVSVTDAEPPQADETPDVSSEAKFVAAATEIAIDKEVSESVFNAAIAKLRLSDGIGGGRSKDTATRAKLWRAMADGRFDWQAAKIKE